MTEAERQQRLAECRQLANDSVDGFFFAFLLAEVERLEKLLAFITDGQAVANQDLNEKQREIERLQKLVQELEAAYALAVAKI